MSGTSRRSSGPNSRSTSEAPEPHRRVAYYPSSTHSKGIRYCSQKARRSTSRTRRWPPGLRKATSFPESTHFATVLGVHLEHLRHLVGGVRPALGRHRRSELLLEHPDQALTDARPGPWGLLFGGPQLGDHGIGQLLGVGHGRPVRGGWPGVNDESLTTSTAGRMLAPSSRGTPTPQSRTEPRGPPPGAFRFFGLACGLLWSRQNPRPGELRP